MSQPPQLISYIALGAPATRRLARGDEPFLRPEIGFTPKWYHDALGIEFGEAWHTNPAVRLASIRRMAREVRRRFPGVAIGCLQDPNEPADALTGAFGACFVPALYGVPIEFQVQDWPWSRHQYLSDEQVTRLQPVTPERHPLFESLLRQLDWILAETGRLAGYLNWQGVLNNAYRLRGNELFLDMRAEPERARHLFECVATTMIEGARLLYARQRQAGFHVDHFTVSNCLVNMVAPDQYRELIFPSDCRIAEAFACLGVHNCAWNASPYMEHYSRLPAVGYIDMGMDSDLVRARRLFPTARRAVMYTPMDVANKSPEQIRGDLQRIAREYAPCDVVFADIESGTPDARVLELVWFCEEIGQDAS